MAALGSPSSLPSGIRPPAPPGRVRGPHPTL